MGGDESAEVDDACVGRDGGEDVKGGVAVDPGVVFPAVHGVDEVIDRVAVSQGIGNGRCIEEVPDRDFDAFGPRTAGNAAGIANEYAHGEAKIEKSGNKATSDIAGGSGNQDAFHDKNIGQVREKCNRTFRFAGRGFCGGGTCGGWRARQDSNLRPSD